MIKKQKIIHKTFFTLLTITSLFSFGLGVAVTSAYMDFQKDATIDRPSNQQNIETYPTPQKSLSEEDIELSFGDWKLILVNKWNVIPDNFEVMLTTLRNGQAVDERCYPDLQEMMDACRAEGLSPIICSSYRSQERQQELFDSEVQECLARGYSQEKAEKEAGKYLATPGTSEHELGLAVDIVDITYQILDSLQEKTEVQQWLMKNSWKYGFILRYPSNKSDITGISYEPWHYRYVGKEAAAVIYKQNICLEEYLQK